MEGRRQWSALGGGEFGEVEGKCLHVGWLQVYNCCG